MAGKYGIAIECISARLQKVRISIKSNFAMFVIAYAPTEQAPKGQKTKCVAILNSPVPSLPAWKYGFISTDANVRAGKRQGRRGNRQQGVDAHGLDVLNDISKVLLCFGEDNKLAILMPSFCTPQKWRVLHHLSKRQLHQGTSAFAPYPDKVGGPLTGSLR